MTGYHLVSQGGAHAGVTPCAAALHQEECAVPSTPRTRQNGFNDDLQMEGAKRKLTARLHIEGNFDAFGPAPAVAHTFLAQSMGAAGLAGFTPIRPRMSPDISV